VSEELKTEMLKAVSARRLNRHIYPITCFLTIHVNFDGTVRTYKLKSQLWFDSLAYLKDHILWDVWCDDIVDRRLMLTSIVVRDPQRRFS
jgi:hypothetical protein